MIARGVGSFVDTTAISVKFTVFSSNELSVVFGVKVDGALGGSRAQELGGLVEIDLILIRVSGRSLC